MVIASRNLFFLGGVTSSTKNLNAYGASEVKGFLRHDLFDCSDMLREAHRPSH